MKLCRLITLLFVVVLSACAEFPMIASQNDVVKMEKSVLKMEKDTDGIKRNQAELEVRLEELTENIFAVTGELEEHINVLSKRMESLERKLRGKSSISSPSTSTKPAGQSSDAKEIHDLAYQDYVKGNYSLAIMGFEELLKRYPDDVLAPKAQYWKGESYFSQEKWEKAIKEFDKVISSFPDTGEARKAKFKKALVLLKLKKDETAIDLLNEIIKKYPLSQEAIKAKEKKKSLVSR